MEFVVECKFTCHSCVPALDPFVFWLTVNYVHQRKALDAYEHGTALRWIVYLVMQFCHVLDQQTCLGLFPGARCDPVRSLPPINCVADGQGRSLGKKVRCSRFSVPVARYYSSPTLFTRELNVSDDGSIGLHCRS